ncbi:tail fiber assembly protein [Xenorhabdus sp. XENO-1]|uniref:tail fiber assembly protein n=1 Tax=Xenorhabdus bovienii TaxID=40576 RepID=UPI0020CA54C8|nr:tail fiber assembly protein [Xenorhabdus bovienii]MCP9269360.1 tail fiber assembly protein [Xenorhabdus bovienii subsp. africana]
MYIYSAKNNAFCPVAWKQRYIDAGTWPDDGVEVGESVFLEFAIETPPTGKRRVAGKNGLPAWGNIPPPTPEELWQQAESQKQRLMNAARDKMAPLQDAVDLDIATDAEKSALTAWRQYRVRLSRVDCTTAPDIKWPEQPK